ncbi:MAG: hypothetical protein QOI95_3072 [Acidimicrobiaceae bacterium]|jgi:hypothetical protein
MTCITFRDVAYPVACWLLDVEAARALINGFAVAARVGDGTTIETVYQRLTASQSLSQAASNYLSCVSEPKIDDEADWSTYGDHVAALIAAAIRDPLFELYPRWSHLLRSGLVERGLDQAEAEAVIHGNGLHTLLDESINDDRRDALCEYALGGVLTHSECRVLLRRLASLPSTTPADSGLFVEDVAAMRHVLATAETSGLGLRLLTWI